MAEPETTPKVSAGKFSTSDMVGSDDTLGFDPYVKAAVDFLQNKKTQAPITISIEGAWGSGKSSFMRQMIKKLNDQHASIIVFNPWRHDKSESLWAAFALALVDQLRKRMSPFRRGLAALKLLGLRYNRTTGKLPAIIYLLKLLFWLVLTGLLIWLWAKGKIDLSEIIAPKTTQDQINHILLFLFGSTGAAASIVAMVTIIRQVFRTVGNPIRTDIGKYLKTVDYAQQIAFIEQFHEDLGKILNAYADEEKIFVFIDDLDRCEVPRAAELMGAINLLVDVKNPLVFILGLDREKVAAGLAVKFESVVPYIKRRDDEVDEDIDEVREQRFLRRAGVEFGYEFIEKFIQLPIRVPVPESTDIDRFLKSLGDKNISPLSESIKPKERKFWSFLKKPFRRKSSAPSLGTEVSTLSADPQKPKDEVVRAWDVFELGSKRDSDEFLKFAKMVAPAMDFNPRRLIHFINNFRLGAYTAYHTGLMNPKIDEYDAALHLPQLGKFVAITLRWPLFIYELEENHTLLSQLAKVAEGITQDAEGIHPRWTTCEPLLNLLSYGTNDPDYDPSLFTMKTLDVEKLLRVSPAVAPIPAREMRVEAPAPDHEPESADDHYKKALNLTNDGQVDRAERHFRQAMEQDPGNPKFVKDFGDFLKETGRLGEAIKEYARAIDMNPEDPDAYIRRGRLYEEDGILEKAIMMYEEALKHGADADIERRVEELKRQMTATENSYDA